jgi:hypothetical protein
MRCQTSFESVIRDSQANQPNVEGRITGTSDYPRGHQSQDHRTDTTKRPFISAPTQRSRLVDRAYSLQPDNFQAHAKATHASPAYRRARGDRAALVEIGERLEGSKTIEKRPVDGSRIPGRAFRKDARRDGGMLIVPTKGAMENRQYDYRYNTSSHL